MYHVILLRQSPHSRHTLAALGFSANFYWTFWTCSATCFRFLCFLFFFVEADGLSKHVVLFENMEKEVVTIGFVWWRRQHTGSASAPLDTSDLLMTLLHHQERDAPCLFRECLPWKPPFWNKTTVLPWKHPPPHFFYQVCLVSWPLCLSLSISHRYSLGFQEHKIETKLSTHGTQMV